MCIVILDSSRFLDTPRDGHIYISISIPSLRILPSHASKHPPISNTVALHDQKSRIHTNVPYYTHTQPYAMKARSARNVKAFPLLRLPREIRDEILAYVLPVREEVNVCTSCLPPVLYCIVLFHLLTSNSCPDFHGSMSDGVGKFVVNYDAIHQSSRSISSYTKSALKSSIVAILSLTSIVVWPVLHNLSTINYGVARTSTEGSLSTRPNKLLYSSGLIHSLRPTTCSTICSICVVCYLLKPTASKNSGFKLSPSATWIQGIIATFGGILAVLAQQKDSAL